MIAILEAETKKNTWRVYKMQFELSVESESLVSLSNDHMIMLIMIEAKSFFLIIIVNDLRDLVTLSKYSYI